MWNAKRLAVAALAALMIVGAIPALASADASGDTAAQQETAVETVKKARKHKKSATTDAARQSVTSGDSTDTARPARKPARQSVSSGDTTDAAKPSRQSVTSGDSTDTARPARKPARQSVNSGDTTDAARPSRKPATSGDTTDAAKPSRKPARKPEKKSASDNGDASAESETI